MGLNWHGVKLLAQIRGGGADFNRSISIGRLNLNVSMPKVRQLLEEAGVPHTLSEADVLAKPTYCEEVFKLLGAQVVDSLDATNYEQATIVADLNQPIPQNLHGQYDLVYDGGTLEHVFNVPQALRNIMSLAKVGGTVVIQTMANNWLGHGFYQFSPELFHRVFSPENGYRVQKLVVHSSYELAPWYEVPDPRIVRGRIEMASPWEGVMLAVHAKREADVPIFAQTPQQSDYDAAWRAAGGEAGTAVSQPVNPLGHHARGSGKNGLKRRLIGSLKSRLPWALRMKHKMLLAMPALPRMLKARAHRQDRKRFSIAAQPQKFKPLDGA
jgi:hypothetical protein